MKKAEMEAELMRQKQSLSASEAAWSRMILAGLSGEPVVRLRAQVELGRRVVAGLEGALSRLQETQIDRAPAWSFVLQYSREIDNIFRKIYRNTIDPEDRRQEYIERIVTRYPSFAEYCARHSVRNVRALALSWLQDQARAAKTTAQKKVRWREEPARPDERGVSILDLTEGREDIETEIRHAQARELVTRLFAASTPDEQEWMLAVLDGLTPGELRARLGIRPETLDAGLAKLRGKVLRLVA
jgi:DNA-directed RNA polymerase specialized sigma24 family protein